MDELRFFDLFVRVEQFVKYSYYGDIIEPIVKNENAKKVKTLFSDAFSHHVKVYSDASAELQFLPDDDRRYVSNDSLTAYFVEKLYEMPNIYESSNVEFSDECKVSYLRFIRSIVDTPITKKNDSVDFIGSNRNVFIIGDVGSGKTLLLSKTIRDIVSEQKRDALKMDFLLVPVYFDFETRMKGYNDKLLDVDDFFIDKLIGGVVEVIQKFEVYKGRLGSIKEWEENNSEKGGAKFISLVKFLFKRGLRLLIILDNVDGYHYYYSKYVFFDKYYKDQVESVRKNIFDLFYMLSSSDKFGDLGMNVVIAARRYVYEDCLHTSIRETASEFDGIVFQLGDIDEKQVVSTRFKLFSVAIKLLEDKVENPEELQGDAVLEKISLLLGIDEKIGEMSTRNNMIINGIRRLSHHGNRGLVSFLSKMGLDYRQESMLVERFFWDKPHTLLLLYMVDLKRRYTQKHGHLPNLFLVDAMVLKKKDFEDCHMPHAHTYWLKYLILYYISIMPGGTASVSQLKRVFVDKGGYDDTLFRLVVGSLATTYESKCIDPEPNEDRPPLKVSITDRGKFLVTEWKKARNSKFCFSFSYLQLVVDDYLMSYPKMIWKDIYVRGVDLSYLMQPKDVYAEKSVQYLKEKMRAVLTFISVLKDSYEVERHKRSKMFEYIIEEGYSIDVNIEEIVDKIFMEYTDIMKSIHQGSQIMKDLRAHWERISNNKDLSKCLGRIVEDANKFIEE